MELSRQLSELRQYAAEHDVPILRPESEKILIELVQERRPLRLLEVGAAIGYSALVLASVMPQNATLCTLELDEQRAAFAKQQVAVAGLQDRITVVVGDAMTAIPQLEGSFDFVFLDGPKGQYLAYLRLLLDKLSAGAVVAADNVLFRGMVTSATPTPRRYRTLVRRLSEYLDFVRTDKRFATTLLPEGDGMAISYYYGSMIHDEH